MYCTIQTKEIYILAFFLCNSIFFNIYINVFAVARHHDLSLFCECRAWSIVLATNSLNCYRNDAADVLGRFMDDVNAPGPGSKFPRPSPVSNSGLFRRDPELAALLTRTEVAFLQYFQNVDMPYYACWGHRNSIPMISAAQILCTFLGSSNVRMLK